MSVLSSQQSVDLQEALSSAFTNAELTRFADNRLELNLETIDGGNLSDKVYHLLKWAEARGKTSDLIDAAVRERPGNRVLVAAAKNARAHIESVASATTVPLDRPVSPGRLPLPAIGRPVGLEPFVGRAEDLERLHAEWETRAHVSGRCVLLVGDPGVGKTRLAARFAEEVYADGAAVLYGHSDEGEILPYQPFVEALRHSLTHGDWMTDPRLAEELREVGRFLPEARRDAEPVRHYSGLHSDMDGAKIDRSRLFESAARLLARAGREGPLLLVVDDLQWADKPTLQLLRHLVRHPETPPLMVLATLRGVEVGDEHPLKQFLEDLSRDRRIVRLAVEGLDERDSGALIAAHLALPAAPDFVRRLCVTTDGNPFFMEETLRALSDSGALAPGDSPSVTLLDETPVPDNVTQVILRRLRLVSRDACEVLSEASVAGRDFDLGLLEALDKCPERVIGALEEAVEAGLLKEPRGMEHADRFSFSHELVRAAIADRMKKVRLMRIHAHIAEILEGRLASGRALPGEVAHHYYLAASDVGVDKTVRAASRAADAAALSLAYEDAATHYQRAKRVYKERGMEDEAGRCGVLLGLGRAAASSLEYEAAEGHYLEALERCTVPGDTNAALRCDVLLALGRVESQAGHPGARKRYLEAGETARRAGDGRRLALAALGMGERYWEANAVDQEYRVLLEQALAEPPEDAVLRARLLARLAASLHFTNDHRADALSREAVAMAQRQPDQKVLASVLMGRHVTRLHVEHLEERLHLIDDVLRIGGHPKLVAEARQWRLYDLFERGDVTSASAELVRLQRLAKELRQPLFLHVADAWQGVWAMLKGDVEEAERLAHASYDLAKQADAYDAESLRTGKLFMLRRQQARIAELLPRIKALAGGRTALPTWCAAYPLALAEVGERDDARDAFQVALEEAEERAAARDEAARGFAAYPRDFFWSTTMALLAETCEALHDEDRAAELLELLRPYAHRNVQVSYACCWGSVARYVGLLCRVCGRDLEAEAHLLAALERHHAMEAPLLVAEVQCDYGALLLARGRPRDRRRAHDLGAKALAEAVRRNGKLEGLATRAAALQS